MSAHGQRVDAFRAVRADAEASVLPLATSVDGRRFSFQAGVNGLALRLGGYAMIEGDGEGCLGQVHSLALTEADLGEIGHAADPADGVDLRTRLRIRLARGDGVLLDRGAAPFHDRLARPATSAEMGEWLAATAPHRARLAVGELSLVDDVPFSLDAGGFDRHTFLCGQSGSGKSYSLGLVLEQLLLETDLRIVILDPNSDFARLPEVRDGADTRLAERWGALAGGIGVHAAAQAALLRLDPVADREEYAELAALLAQERPESLAELATVDRAEARRLQLRIQNLGVEQWSVWARQDGGSVLGALDDPDVRCLVVDLGSLPTRDEQALVAESVLRALWDRRLDRRPVLAVLDEAHNVCPAQPGDPLTALATEHAIRIAGEGRKFGIYMLVATQRPQKVHENVISQCDNLILMRLNSAADSAFIADLLGFAPPGLIGLATDFGLGEALVAGKIASHPAVMRFGSRVASEGGGDVDADWARPGRG
jgi:DNA helicase HerA-like ATPase